MRVVRSVAAAAVLGVPSFLFAQEPIEPRPLPIDIEARPINDAAADVPLRWKAKNAGIALSAESLPPVPIQSPSPVVQASGLMPIQTSTTRASWNITRIDPSVRPAQAVSDPFQDPFGDRRATQAVAQEPTLLLQPTQAERAIEALPPPRAAAPELRAPQRMNTPANPLVSNTQPPPPGVPGGTVPSVTQPPSSVPGGNVPGVTQPFTPDAGTPRYPDASAPAIGGQPPLGTGQPCDQVYNDRNCCDNLAKCNEFRNSLFADSISHITLDITPRYSPDLTPADDLTERTDRLRPAEIITWHNRRGAVVATGRLVNLSNNMVIIADESGREVARLSVNELGEDELCYVTAWWRLPAECGLGGIRVASRTWMPSTFAWTASSLCHKPLYFEEVQLERYGHTAGPIRQPIISGAHFFLNIAALPYNMAINPPKECQYALGYYRPGSCAPWMIPPIPLSLRGAAAEAVTVVGGVFLLP